MNFCRIAKKYREVQTNTSNKYRLSAVTFCIAVGEIGPHQTTSCCSLCILCTKYPPPPSHLTTDPPFLHYLPTLRCLHTCISRKAQAVCLQAKIAGSSCSWNICTAEGQALKSCSTGMLANKGIFQRWFFHTRVTFRKSLPFSRLYAARPFRPFARMSLQSKSDQTACSWTYWYSYLFNFKFHKTV